MRREADRGYESDRGPGAPYFPPPPRIAVDEPEDQHNTRGDPAGSGAQGPYIPRPYNPNEYGAAPGTRDDYFTGHPQEQQPYVPPPAPQGQQPQGVSSTSSLSNTSTNIIPNSLHPLAAEYPTETATPP
jgi:hypothetical protein